MKQFGENEIPQNDKNAEGGGKVQNKKKLEDRVATGEIDLKSILEKDENFLSSDEWNILYEIISEKESKLGSIRKYKPTLGRGQGATDGGIDAWYEEVREYERDLRDREREIEHLKKVKKFVAEMELESSNSFKDKISRYKSSLGELSDIDKNNDHVFSGLSHIYYGGVDYIPGVSEEHEKKLIEKTKNFVQNNPHSLDVACEIVESRVGIYELCISKKIKTRTHIYSCDRAVAAFTKLGNVRFDGLNKKKKDLEREYDKLD